MEDMLKKHSDGNFYLTIDRKEFEKLIEKFEREYEEHVKNKCSWFEEEIDECFCPEE